MTRLLLISLLATLTTAPIFGQQDFLLRPDKTLPTGKQWTDLQLQFNSIPTDRLNTIEKELDSTISATDCYKFIYNADTTKFLAFFIMREDNPKLNKLIHFGRSVHIHYRPSDGNFIESLSYVLWGMKYEGNWYYHKDYEDEFWDKADKSAKDDYLYYVLEKVGFLKENNAQAFWKKGGESNIFGILPKNNSYLDEFAGLPEIVGWHRKFLTRRQNDLMNEKIEKTACAIENDLWNTLHMSDSIAFHSRHQSKYSGKSCFVLYNPDRSKLLLPILYHDNKSQPWVTYYFLKANPTGTTLYKWTKFPTKKINRISGDETLEVVYDIRTFIQNWNWGTANMISTESFWTDNFYDKDLQVVKDNVR